MYALLRINQKSKKTEQAYQLGGFCNNPGDSGYLEQKADVDQCANDEESGLGYVSKTEPGRFADGVNVGHERNKGVKAAIWVHVLSN